MTDGDAPEDPRVERLRSLLQGHGVEAESTVRSDVQEALRQESSVPGSYDAAIELALQLADEGIDPERVLTDALPAVVAVAARAGSPEPIADWLQPFGELVRTLESAGHRTWDAVSFGVPGLCELCGPDLPLFRHHVDAHRSPRWRHGHRALAHLRARRRLPRCEV